MKITSRFLISRLRDWKNNPDHELLIALGDLFLVDNIQYDPDDAALLEEILQALDNIDIHGKEAVETAIPYWIELLNARIVGVMRPNDANTWAAAMLRMHALKQVLTRSNQKLLSGENLWLAIEALALPDKLKELILTQDSSIPRPAVLELPSPAELIEVLCRPER